MMLRRFLICSRSHVRLQTQSLIIHYLFGRLWRSSSREELCSALISQGEGEEEEETVAQSMSCFQMSLQKETVSFKGVKSRDKCVDLSAV